MQQLHHFDVKHCWRPSDGKEAVLETLASKALAFQIDLLTSL